MGHVSKIMVAVPFALPKMHSVLFGFLRTSGKKVPNEPQNDNLPYLKGKILSWEVDFVLGDVRQHALSIFRQRIANVNPFQLPRSFGG